MSGVRFKVTQAADGGGEGSPEKAEGGGAQDVPQVRIVQDAEGNVIHLF